MKKIVFSLFLFITSLSFGQKTSPLAPASDYSDLKQHVETLASDKMEGRETGTKGEQMAADYIIKEFKENGIFSYPDKNYTQEFNFLYKRSIGKNNKLKLNRKKLKAGTDYFPLAFSGNGSISGKAVYVGNGLAVSHTQDYPITDISILKDKIFIIETGAGKSPHHQSSNQTALLKRKVQLAKEKGAIGIVFINSSEEEDLEPNYRQRIPAESIPIVFVKGKKNIENISKVKLSTEMTEERRTGKNVVAFINNKAKRTIVLGAHYDHLGYGHAHNSLYRGEPKIHNGADDNASGVAILLETAEALSNKKFNSYNYLFIAFSGEEMGLLGSEYFVENAFIELDKIEYMINMDMVGRMENQTLLINGTGTGEQWEEILSKNEQQISNINYKYTKSGVGASDHTSFYNRKIPVLSFFSGVHSDYHTPADDAHLINYRGMHQIKNVILNIIKNSLNYDSITYQKTGQEDSRKAPKLKVTLGVVPDYGFEGKGMRITGVSEGKPAIKAGLEGGDVIIGLGGQDINDIYDYMNILSLFGKGDKADVVVERNKEQKTFTLEF